MSSRCRRGLYRLVRSALWSSEFRPNSPDMTVHVRLSPITVHQGLAQLSRRYDFVCYLLFERSA